MKQIYLKDSGAVAADAIDQTYRLESGKLEPMRWGVKCLDEAIPTLWAGRLMTIIGRPGHFKTGLAIHLARLECKRIMEHGTNDRVLFMTLEEAETDVLLSLADTDRQISDIVMGKATAEEVRSDIYGIPDFPVLLVGYRPLQEAEYEWERGLPSLSFERINTELLEYVKETGVRISAIFVDYLQVLATEENEESFNLTVGAMMRKLRVLGQTYECPVVVGAQAKETVDLLRPPVPKGNHAFYSSQILHTSDVMVSTVLPAKYPPSSFGGKGVITVNSRQYTVRDGLLLLSLLKQRRAVGHGTFVVQADLARNRIMEAEPNEGAFRVESGERREPTAEQLPW